MVLSTQNEGGALTPFTQIEKGGLPIVVIAPCRLGGKNTFPGDEVFIVSRQTRDTLVMQRQAVDYVAPAEEDNPAETAPAKNSRKRGNK